AISSISNASCMSSPASSASSTSSSSSSPVVRRVFCWLLPGFLPRVLTVYCSGGFLVLFSCC
ncbi:MAG: hypothetical protein WCH11_02995, partial [Bdellovibrio sp.]